MAAMPPSSPHSHLTQRSIRPSMFERNKTFFVRNHAGPKDHRRSPTTSGRPDDRAWLAATRFGRPAPIRGLEVAPESAVDEMAAQCVANFPGASLEG